METYLKRKITKISDNIFKEIEDYIAVEKKLRIFINNSEITSLYCTPTMIKELVTGLLLTEGIINESTEDMEINIKDDEVIAYLTSNDKNIKDIIQIRHLCGYTIFKNKFFNEIKDDLLFSYSNIKELFEDFQNKCKLFKLTGCFHSSAISDKEKIIAFAEDIGRHNSVDKVIGSCILNKITLNDKMIFVSCRLSSEILYKCAKWSIPLIVSISAPTSLAIEIAEKTGITLIGFFRDSRANVYTNKHRII